MSNLRLLQLQLALFFDTAENRPDKLISKVDEALEGIFDQMPTILPIPQDSPVEVPSVIMQSTNGVYTCNISKTRIDFIVNYSNSRDSAFVNVEDFVKKVRPFSAAIYGYKDIVRFGLVGRYFYKHNNPVSKIQAKYFKQDFGVLEELNLRFNKRFESNDLICNDVVEINKGSLSENGRPQQDGVIIVRDMNNVPVGSVSLEDIISIISSRQNSFSTSGIMELVE